MIQDDRNQATYFSEKKRLKWLLTKKKKKRNLTIKKTKILNPIFPRRKKCPLESKQI